MDVHLFDTPPPPPPPPGVQSVLRSCYNVSGLAPGERKGHLDRLFLVPKQREVRRKVKREPRGYSVAVQLAGGALAVPRFYGLEHWGAPHEDRSVEGAPASFAFSGDLLPYQEQVVDRTEATVRGVGGALLSAGCGTGKTVMCIALAARLGVRTAVLVHKGFLVEQWKARVAQFAPQATVGVVVQDRNDIATCDPPPDVAICMIQTVLSRYAAPTGAFDSVGLVVVDECHHICAESFGRALLSFPARLRLGLTATPERRDGLGFALPWLLGPLACTVRRAYPDVEVRWIDGAPSIEAVTDTRTGEMLYAATVSRLVASETRNRRLLRVIRAGLDEGRNIIVISERRAHLEQLMEATGDGSLYLGETSKKRKREREERALTSNPLFASYSMGEEGLDIPRLDMLVFASPRGSPACVEQCVGRILRVFPGKPTPRIVDVRDGVFVSMARERSRLYRSQGFTVATGLG
jgi:superfamily II DNA or RNA helicase